MTSVMLVEIIKKYPCLYNNQCPEYARKEYTEKVWKQVADEMGMLVGDVKNKWKNLRNGLVRSIKPVPESMYRKKKKKIYYLYQAMEFVIPYLNLECTDPQNSIIRSDDQSIEDCNEMKVEFVDPDNEDHYNENGDEKSSSDDEVLAKKAKIGEEIDVIELLRRQQSDNDPRRMFLLSLLPDINNLSDEQMSKFRIKVLLLLEEVKATSSPRKKAT